MRIPPPILGALAAGAMWLVSEATGATISFPSQGATALGFISLGLAIDLWAILAFRRAQTTVNPLTPEKTAAIVTSGPYRFSRNPMYVGLTLVLIGWGVYLGDPSNALLLAVFVIALTRLQIVPEEKALAAGFGAVYETYRSTTRRWL